MQNLCFLLLHFFTEKYTTSGKLNTIQNNWVLKNGNMTSDVKLNYAVQVGSSGVSVEVHFTGIKKRYWKVSGNMLFFCYNVV